MRPPADERAVRILRENVPEFENHYLDLKDIYDEDLTPQVVFNDLAEFVRNSQNLWTGPTRSALPLISFLG